jgi:hypothetical protein
MNPKIRFTVPNPPIASESFGDEAVIVNLQQGTYYSVRGPAFMTWNLVSAGVAVGAIIEHLAATYDAPASEIEAAVTALLAEIEREGLIVPAERDASFPQIERAPAATRVKEPFARPVLEKFTDVQELLALDPVHDVDGTGWPRPKADPRDDEDLG